MIFLCFKEKMIHRTLLQLFNVPEIDQREVRKRFDSNFFFNSETQVVLHNQSIAKFANY